MFLVAKYPAPGHVPNGFLFRPPNRVILLEKSSEKCSGLRFQHFEHHVVKWLKRICVAHRKAMHPNPKQFSGCLDLFRSM
jgi:hypothetical protein